MNSIYVRPGRFEVVPYKDYDKLFIDKVVDILERAKAVGFFKRSGVVSGKFGMKSYNDVIITELENLCLNDQFRNDSTCQQLSRIKEVLDHEQQEGLCIIRPNPQIEKFLKAVQNRNEDDLEEIMKEIPAARIAEPQEEKVSDQILQNLYTLSRLTPPEKRSFKKLQALAAAQWWLKTLDIITKIQAKIKGNIEFKSLNLTDVQKRIFVTTLADLIWDFCQLSGGNIIIFVSFKSEFVIQALKAARIEGLDTNMGLPILALVRQDGSVTCEYGNFQNGSIYNPEDKKDEALDLPSDQKIVFRDILSTLTTGSSNGDQLNIRHLPEEALFHIITHIRPEEMKEGQLSQELKANYERLIRLDRFFNQNKEPINITYITERIGYR